MPRPSDHNRRSSLLTRDATARHRPEMTHKTHPADYPYQPLPYRNKQFTVRGYDLQFTSESNPRCETIIFGIGLTRDRPASNNSRHFLGVGGYPGHSSSLTLPTTPR